MSTSGYDLQSELLICRAYPAKACKEVYQIENEGRRWKIEDRRTEEEDRRCKVENIRQMVEERKWETEDRRLKTEIVER